MVPAIPCSFGSITIFAVSSSSPKKEIHLTRCSAYGKSPKPSLSQQRFMLPQSLPFKLFQKYGSGCGLNCRTGIKIFASVGTNVATDEPNPAVSDEGAEGASEPSSASPGSNEASSSGPRTTKRPRPVRKSEMPPVTNEELLPGASFTGKIRSIQPFGAFVDFGAFTDGLVHVSNLSNEFVKDVGSFVSVGQEVTVKILEANMETGRISLTMRDGDDVNKLQQRKEASASFNNEKPRTPRKDTGRSNQKREGSQKSSKFVEGQVLDGTVKNIIRSGAFISLPEGEEGFLPTSEESEGFTVLGSSSLQVGEEVNVRVLRVTRGRVTLTMKKEKDLKELNMKLNQGVVHMATNPFELAFRKNKDIAAFLDEREKLKQSPEPSSVSETPEQIEEMVNETPTESGALGVEDNTVSSSLLTVPATFDTDTDEDSVSSEKQSEEATVDEKPESISDLSQDVGSSTETSLEEENSSKSSISKQSEEATVDKKPESSISDLSWDVGSSSQTSLEEENSSKSVIFKQSEEATVDEKHESSISDLSQDVGSSPETSLEEENSSKSSSLEEDVHPTGSVVNDVSVANNVNEPGTETKTIDIDDPETPVSEENGSAGKSVVDESPQLDGGKENDSASAAIPEDKSAALSIDVHANDSADTLEDATAAESLKAENDDSTTANSQTVVATQDSSTKATISPALVKQLREETGAGMMDCKKALAETGGDIVKAQELLRMKGLASADKRASRATAEGRIGSYIHDNRIGVLIEVNCETDFVSRGDMFKELVDDLAMQVAACPQVQYLIPEDVPEEIVNKEREIEMQKEDILTKPEQIRSKIVDGRIRKRLEELALLEQPYIKNDKLAVKDLVKQTIATIGENIKVRRFVRFNLGEGLEKKSQDFAAEVAAQTTAKQAPPVQKDKPAATTETAEKPQTVAVSAALVKQLRDETGAGMMDCKKALADTGGDLEKAQEYLGRKGLASADKKSSRLAAEGRISSYIHDSRIGVLIEVNSETDFVGRNEKFRELVDDLAMQVAACPQVEFVSMEDIPESIVSKEKEIEMQREDLKSKPENIREKIVEGRVSKRLGELALLEQPFIKDDSLLVKDLVKQTVAALGENIRVRRFTRFTLGESND